MPRKEGGPSTPSMAQAQQVSASDGIDAYELPRSLVTRIARSAIPENAKLQKEVVLALLKGSTVFINYLAATAHDVAASKQHKSISASDVLKALELAQFGDMVEKLQNELNAYRELQKTDKGRKSKGKAKEVDTASAASSGSKAQGKQKATIVIPGSRAPFNQLEHPLAAGSSVGDDVEGDGDETEDDARVVGVPSEPEDEGAPEQETYEDEVEEDEEDEEETESEEDADMMTVEEEMLRGDTRGFDDDANRDQDAEMET